jgi:hypothetical protein
MKSSPIARELHRISTVFLSALEGIVNSVLLIALRNIIWPGKRNTEYPDALKVKTLSVATIVSQLLALDDSLRNWPGGMHVGNKNLLQEYADNHETRDENLDNLNSSVADKLNSVVVAVRIHSDGLEEADLTSVRAVLDDESNFVQIPSLVAKLVSDNTSTQDNNMDISFLVRRTRGKSLMINSTRSNPWLSFQQSWRGHASFQKLYSASISSKSCEETVVLMLLLNAYICNMSRIILNSGGNASARSRVPAQEYVHNLAYVLQPNINIHTGQRKKTLARNTDDSLVEDFKTLMNSLNTTTAAAATNVTDTLHGVSYSRLLNHCTSNPMDLRRNAATRHHYLIPDLLFSKFEAVQEWREFFLFNLAQVASKYMGCELELVSTFLRETREKGFLAELLLQGVSMVCDHSEDMERTTYVKVHLATGSSLESFESKELGLAIKSAKDCFAHLYQNNDEFCFTLGLATYRLLDSWDFSGAMNIPAREADAEPHSSEASQISPTARCRQGWQMMILRLVTSFATVKEKGTGQDAGEANDDAHGSKSGSSSESDESA